MQLQTELDNTAFKKSVVLKMMDVATKEKNLAVQIIIIVAAWASFFMLPFLFFPYNREHSPFQSQRFVYLLISSNILLICFYYLNRSVFIPKLLAKKMLLIYVAAIIACLFLYLTILYVISANSPETKEFLSSPYSRTPYWKYSGPKFFSSGPLTLFLIAFVVSTGSKIITQWFTAEEIKDEVTKQQLQTELTLLKSQVNPHFLFNTLNSIYSLAVTNNEKTSDSVMKLSRIMRYTLEESQNDYVSLHQEVEFINSYIELQKIRLTDNVHINFTTTGNTEYVKIAPLLFIPFIENAFKFGVSTHHSSKIIVSINVDKNVLTFACINDFLPSPKIKQEGTGTGISNTRRRLELLYDNSHTLKIQPGEHEFKVFLTINSLA